MTPEAAALELAQYHESSPRPTATGEEAKTACLSHALASMSQRNLLEVYRLRWGTIPKAQACDVEYLAAIIGRAQKERAARLKAEVLSRMAQLVDNAAGLAVFLLLLAALLGLRSMLAKKRKK